MDLVIQLLIQKTKSLWKFFGFYIIFLPDEVCMDYFLLIKKLFKKSIVISYCRYLRGYIPSKRLLKEGGYGVVEEIHYFGLPSKLATETEKNIIQTLNLLKKMIF